MKCKFCGSSDVVKYGVDWAGGRHQRYLCKTCGRVFKVKIKEKEVKEKE